MCVAGHGVCVRVRVQCVEGRGVDAVQLRWSLSPCRLPCRVRCRSHFPVVRVAMCCSVLQCVAVCFSVLQCGAAC